MILYKHKKLFLTTFSVMITTLSLVTVSFGTWSSSSISAIGMINYWPIVEIMVDVNNVIGVNNLSLGFQLDWERWKKFLDSPVQQQLAIDARLKLVRVFDFRPTNPRLMPCIYWNESTKTGIWNWTWVDLLTRKIFEIGAEPLFCLGYVRPDMQNYIPPGMAINPETELPYPESYAAYAAEWVKHFMQAKLPVRFYEIGNEPMAYFGWSTVNITKLSYYVELWNYAARVMRRQNPNILISTDAITRRQVLDYWLEHGDDVDYLDFHKYDANTIGQYTDAEMFRRAELIRFETTSTTYGINEARQKWLSKRGKLLPVVNSESNFNSAWETGTDPKIQQMAGAVWLALVLRQGILKGLNYNVYFEFSSRGSAQKIGLGFGMINVDNNKPWYPYYVHKMIGQNLALNDPILASFSSSEDIRVLAWRNGVNVNILLISKSNETNAVRLSGIIGKLNVTWIDSTIPFTEPATQCKIIDANEVLLLKGYTVMLLQTI